AEVPKGYLLVPGGTQVTYEAQPDAAGTDGSVVVSDAATVTAVVFPDTALARAIASHAVSGYGNQAVSLVDTAGLTLAFASSTTSLSSGSTLNFTISGSTTVLWTVDATKIAGAVAGKS